MFGLFKTPDFQHPQLGVFKWSRGCWRGDFTLPGHRPVPLILGGSRKGPDTDALMHAIALASDFAGIEPRLQRALLEHYEPYAEVVRLGELKLPDDSFPVVAGPADALQKAEPEAVVIVDLDGELATEVCYRVPWDKEHTLGARFRGKQWIELCGSTLVP